MTQLTMGAMMSELETTLTTNTDFAMQQYLAENVISASLGYIALSVCVFFLFFKVTLHIMRKSCDDGARLKVRSPKDEQINHQVAVGCGMVASLVTLFLLFL